MNTKTTEELCIIALLDGRPGHEKQTMGIIQALQEKAPVQVVRLPVKGFSLIGTLVETFRLYLPCSVIGSNSLAQVGHGDLLIGAGSRTHLPMLLYKKKFGIPAVTCMAPAKHLRNRFDICFVPEHDGVPEAGNVKLTVGAPNCSKNKKNHKNDCGLILLGGVDTKSHHWDSRRIVKMVEQIVKTESRKCWTVSSSPRTPPETLTMISQLAEKYNNITFFDYRNTPSGWVEEQYDKNSVVWVTADSISMVYEAMTAGCGVGIIPVQWLNQNSKFNRNEDILLEKRLVTSFASWEQGQMPCGEDIEINEAQRCADCILQKWWPEYLH